MVYDTAIDLCVCYEDLKYGRGDREELEREKQRYHQSDLLILDDLGTEMSTSHSVSAVYEVLNTRLREGRSTVVSSNLSAEEISRRYSPQIASRLLGSYEELRFYGTDIRLQKKSEG